MTCPFIKLTGNLCISMHCCRSIVAGDHKFVFLVKGHLILVAISYAKESEAQVTVV